MHSPSRQRIHPIAILLAAISIVVTLESSGVTCYVAPRPGDQVAIADEAALILWDSANKTEHFIRRGTFETSAQDFGFLVPTPTVPQFSEVDSAVFSELSRLTEPRIVYQSKPKSQGGGCGCLDAAAPASRATPGAANSVDEALPQVMVHSEQQIAGQDVAVLSADDAKSIAQWLEEHDYAVSPALTEWMKPYVAQGWKISAFKFAKRAEGSPAVKSQAVCLSFATEKPFYPYREPAAEPTRTNPAAGPQPARGPVSRLLRVYFIGEARVDGTIGTSGTRWPGRAVWSNAVAGGQREQILKNLHLPGEAPSGEWRLTEFEDHSSPRPGTDDLWFAPGEDQGFRERPPTIRYVSRDSGEGLLLYAMIGGAIVIVLRRRSGIR